jgi:hypothetical protein
MILLTILYLIIFLQIIFAKPSSSIIIVELLLTFLNSIFSATLQYPYYFGQTDIPAHIDWATIVFATGRTLPPEYSAGAAYTFYPYLQIFTSIGTYLLNVSILQSDLIITGILFSLSILFIYCISRLITDDKIALLACLFFSTTNEIVAGGIHTVPFCIAFVFFVLLFFLIFKINSSNTNKIVYIGLIIPVIIALVYTHHATIMQVILLFLFFYCLIKIFENLNGTEKKFNPFPIVLLIGAFLIHWYYVARERTMTMEHYAIDFLTQSDVGGISIPQGIKSSTEIGTFQDTLNFVINLLPYDILFFFVILGTGIVIKQKFQKYLWIYATIAFLSLLLWIPVGSAILNLFTQFAISRFTLLTSPFIMIIFAFGFYYILNYRFNVPQKYVVILLTSLFIVYSFVLLINIPAYDYISKTTSMHYTPYFNEEDMTSINFFNEKTDNGVNIRSDYLPYRYYIKKDYSITIQNIGLHYFRTGMLNYPGSNSNEEGYIFYRKGEFKKANFLMVGASQAIDYKAQPIPYTKYEVFEQSFFNSNKIVNTGNNNIFFNY